jgi:hypothetical protein
MTDTHCLNCGSTRVHRSRRRSPIEYAIALVGWRVKRCHDCKTRFLQCGRSLVKATSLKDLGKGLLFAVLAVAAVGVVIAVILWFAHGQAAPAPTVEGRLIPPPRVVAPAVLPPVLFARQLTS